MPTGVLPKQTLERLLTSGNITDVPKKHVNPASIDLPLTDEAYALTGIFLPQPGESVAELVKRWGRPHDLKNQLEIGVPYAIKVRGRWKLPPNIYGYLNPKSSSGRINLFCRTVADKVDMFDSTQLESWQHAGWEGDMWVLAVPNSFPVKLAPNDAVSQIRLFDGKSFLDKTEANLYIAEKGLIFTERHERIEQPRQHSDSFVLTLDVGENLGWECRGTRNVLEFGKERSHKASDFFEPVHARNGEFLLRKGGFYILSTRERVRVPPTLSAELRAIDPRFGEFRSHAAGYIDPGWGYGKDGSECGRPITLEIISHENMIVRHGQAIARLRYERMKEAPTVAYDDAKSHYVEQSAAQLSKHFVL